MDNLKRDRALMWAIGCGTAIGFPDNSGPEIEIYIEVINHELKQLGYEVREIPETDGELVRRSL